MLRPEFGSLQQQRTGDVSEVEGDAEVAASMDGTEPNPTDKPVLDTLEEREQCYQEASSLNVTVLSA